MSRGGETARAHIRPPAYLRPMTSPAPIKRGLWIKCRVNEIELAAAEARAKAEGLGVSELIRREVCGMEPPTTRRARRQRPVTHEPEPETQDFDVLVERYAATMPRRNAEYLARKKLRSTDAAG